MFLETHKNLNYNIILDNFETVEKDYYYLKNNKKFYDYSSMEKLLNNPQDTGHCWIVSPLFYNKKEWLNLSLDIRKLKTIELINDLNIKPILGTFSIVRPNSTLDDHEDHDEHCIAGRNDTSVIKYHLGIESIVSQSAGLVVGGETSFVDRKKLNIFNENINHYAYNHSNFDRGVLILSFLESDLNE
jgi:hypothetical protein